jgi:hypothetical protein
LILSRIATELKNQNWITVVLELVVVVAGIFLGLQADAWYEARDDRLRERFHLQQLNLDAGLNTAELERMAEHHASRADELMFAVGVIRKGNIGPEEVERFKWAILTMLQYPPAEVTTGAYDALIASGDFSVLRDTALRSQLVKLQSYFDALENRIKNLIGSEQRAELISDEIAYAIPHPSGKGILWRVDYELLRDNRGTLALLANERRNHSIVHDVYAAGAKLSAEVQKSTELLVSQD